MILVVELMHPNQLLGRNSRSHSLLGGLGGAGGSFELGIGMLHITNRQGAVSGTSYAQATDEIKMSVSVNGNVLTALVTFTPPQMMPYSEAEKLGIATYQIVDANGMIVKEGATESAEIVTGQAIVNIQLDDIDSGSYKLIVTTFVTEKKADQPLNLNGNWEHAFMK